MLRPTYDLRNADGEEECSHWSSVQLVYSAIFIQGRFFPPSYNKHRLRQLRSTAVVDVHPQFGGKLLQQHWTWNVGRLSFWVGNELYARDFGSYVLFYTRYYNSTVGAENSNISVYSYVNAWFARTRPRFGPLTDRPLHYNQYIIAKIGFDGPKTTGLLLL